MAGFCDSGNGLQAPDFANCGPESPKVSSPTPKYSRFWETGFDLHCLTEYAVQLAKFCVAHYARKSLNSIPSRNIWQYMRDNWLSNRVFKSYDDSRGVDIRRLA
jgi:hypothetical protein